MISKASGGAVSSYLRITSMAIFDRERVAEIIDCIERGASIPVGADGWTQCELLMAMAACKNAATPMCIDEQGEADARELAEAVDLIGNCWTDLVAMLRNGAYSLPPRVKGVIAEEDGVRGVALI